MNIDRITKDLAEYIQKSNELTAKLDALQTRACSMSLKIQKEVKKHEH